MENLIDMIREFGNLSYDAGVCERDGNELCINKADKARMLFQGIIRFIGIRPKAPDAKDVPCELCHDAEESERNFCYNCGRDLHRI